MKNLITPYENVQEIVIKYFSFSGVGRNSNKRNGIFCGNAAHVQRANWLLKYIEESETVLFKLKDTEHYKTNRSRALDKTCNELNVN